MERYQRNNILQHYSYETLWFEEVFPTIELILFLFMVTRQCSDISTKSYALWLLQWLVQWLVKTLLSKMIMPDLTEFMLQLTSTDNRVLRHFSGPQNSQTPHPLNIYGMFWVEKSVHGAQHQPIFRNMMLHFKSNGSRFREQQYAIFSMSDRCRACVAAGGGHTRYCLNFIYFMYFK